MLAISMTCQVFLLELQLYPKYLKIGRESYFSIVWLEQVLLLIKYYIKFCFAIVKDYIISQLGKVDKTW